MVEGQIDVPEGLQSHNNSNESSNERDFTNENVSGGEEEHNSGDLGKGKARVEETICVGNIVDFDSDVAVNGKEDIVTIKFDTITPEGLMRFHFPNADTAFMFYNWYASVKGFAARKDRIVRTSNGQMTQQIFVCHKEGKRLAKFTNSRRIRRARPITRCGCNAKCMVHIEHSSQRWYIKMLQDVHNHPMIDKNFSTMLPAHRKMEDNDKYQMMCMRKSGIKTSQIYGYLSYQAGGYDKMGYLKRDIYNEQFKQKRSKFTDAKDALEFLEGMKKKDELMFWRYTKDDKGRLAQLFWCDGVGRKDFSVFGDVLAFDATYKKNSYLCPFVVFSGVNHHNQSNVYATAIVVNESEETYVWLLEQFLIAMDGKSPVSVITDGCPAMRNAIKKVFPTAHHRLCAWHLLKNATTNIKNPKFVPKFRQCMLGDYDVAEFEFKWANLVNEFGLEGNKWAKEIYEKRHMWAAAHIRGNFFAGFRTTSRCESLNSEFGKYVDCQDNLLEFLENYFRWLNGVRFREVEAGFFTASGDLELETQLRSLERSAAEVYTREVFLIFRPVLQKSLTYKVVGIREMASCYIYVVSKYGRDDIEWRVSFSQASLEFKCSCEKLESIGIPCEHLVTVMVHMNIIILPDCVILKRWTKNAKDSVYTRFASPELQAEPELIYQYMGLVERGKRWAKAAVKCRNVEYIRKTIEVVTKEIELLEGLCCSDDTNQVDNESDDLFEGPIRNPVKARHKGCGAAAEGSSSRTTKKARKCGVCGYWGHNKKSCYLQRQMDFIQSQTMSNNVNDYDNLDQAMLFE